MNDRQHEGAPPEPAVITVEDCLYNYDFQDWLAKYDVLKRHPLTPESFELNTTTISGEHRSERMLKLLRERQGYLVPNDEVANVIFRRSTEERITDLRAMARSALQYLQTQKLVHPEILYYANEIGYGAGVSNVAVAATGLKVLYRLWQNFRAEVNETDLAQSVDAYSVEALRGFINRLRREALPATKLRLDIRRRPDTPRAYRLAARTDAELMPDQLTWPDYLAPEYQRWLASPDVELLTTWPDEALGQSPLLNPDKKEDQLFALLQEHKGMLVPYRVLAQAIYGDQDQLPNLKGLINNLRLRRKLAAYHAFVLPDEAIGYGIQDLAPTLKELQVLELLWQSWKDNGRLTSRNDITLKLYGEVTDKTTDRTAHVIRLLEDRLKPTTFSLASTDRRYHLAYGLIKTRRTARDQS